MDFQSSDAMPIQEMSRRRLFFHLKESSSQSLLLDRICLFFLTTTLWSSIFQIFTLPTGGFYPSLTLLSSLALIPFTLRYLRFLAFPPTIALIGLMGCFAVSLVWSSDVLAGVRTLVNTLPFLLIFMAATAITLTRKERMLRALRIFFLLFLIQAVLVIAFRISPGLKMAFLGSPVAIPFVGANALEAVFEPTGGVNVVDPEKSGGFFTNGNVAAAFSGCCALLAVATSMITGCRRTRIIAFVAWISVFFTGSKSAMAMALVIPALAAFAFVFLIPQCSSWRLPFTAAFAIGLCAVASVLLSPAFQNSDLMTSTDTTLKLRQEIWSFAGDQFPRHIWLGHGFGGWEEAFAPIYRQFGLRNAVPPHNTFILLWSQSGIVAAIFGLAFMCAIIVASVRGFSANDVVLRILAIGTLGSFLWLFIHGLGENEGIIGELHFQPVMAVTLGMLRARTLALRGIRA